MDAVEKIQEMENKRTKLGQAISKAKQNLHAGEKKAETHVKAAIGGGVLALYYEGKMSAESAIQILDRSNAGVQKQGLGRDKFEALRAKFRKSEE